MHRQNAALPVHSLVVRLYPFASRPSWEQVSAPMWMYPLEEKEEEEVCNLQSGNMYAAHHCCCSLVCFCATVIRYVLMLFGAISVWLFGSRRWPHANLVKYAPGAMLCILPIDLNTCKFSAECIGAILCSLFSAFVFSFR